MKKLKCPFGGTEIGEAQRHVSADHADQRDPVNVVTLGDHLRADEQIEFAIIERAQSAFEIIVTADSVAIEAGDAGLRETSVQ